MSLCFRLGHSDSSDLKRLHLPSSLQAGSSCDLEWTFEPKKRGPCVIHLEGVESKFPFGFLVKSFGQIEENYEILTGEIQKLFEELEAWIENRARS